MRDLLSDLNIENRLVNENYDINSILEDIDYKNVKYILEKKIQFSKDFLKNNMSNI